MWRSTSPAAPSSAPARCRAGPAAAGRVAGLGPPGADEQDRGMSNASSARRGRYRQAARDAAFLLRL